ncbi:hypothetical protein EPI10_020792 [Gossypium australe]|uniref:Uncharacterized protein n=1 Tax=Gossypium australe TaxID=47621 RepID=A0A5B6WEW0_9ROSI|nr:hypothetical protein EPI10_020792 [Gossypium australe]
MNERSWDASSSIVPNGRKMGQPNKSSRLIDEDSSDNKNQEVANICLMAIDDPKLQYAYDELDLEFETMVSKYKKTISKLKDENSSLSKANHELKSKIHDMQEIINDFEKNNQDLHNFLS